MNVLDRIRKLGQSKKTPLDWWKNNEKILFDDGTHKMEYSTFNFSGQNNTYIKLYKNKRWCIIIHLIYKDGKKMMVEVSHMVDGKLFGLSSIPTGHKRIMHTRRYIYNFNDKKNRWV